MELVAAGKLTRTFGKEGEIIAVLYDRFPAKLDTREPLYLRQDGMEVPLFISRLERRGRSGALIVFDDIDNEQRAALILGREFFIGAAMACEPEPGDGLSRLTGYTAVLHEAGRADTGISGRIAGIAGNDANPLFSIDYGGQEILVPAAEEMVREVNHAGRVIHLEIPSGLLDLYP